MTTKYAKIDDADLLNYYQAGNIFQWINFTSVNLAQEPQVGDT